MEQDNRIEADVRRQRINRMKAGIVWILVCLILISIGLNLYLLIRVVQLSNVVQSITDTMGFIRL